MPPAIICYAYYSLLSGDDDCPGEDWRKSSKICFSRLWSGDDVDDKAVLNGRSIKLMQQGLIDCSEGQLQNLGISVYRPYLRVCCPLLPKKLERASSKTKIPAKVKRMTLFWGHHDAKCYKFTRIVDGPDAVQHSMVYVSGGALGYCRNLGRLGPCSLREARRTDYMLSHPCRGRAFTVG